MDSFGEMVSREMQNRKTSRERRNHVFSNSLVGFMVVFPMKGIGQNMLLCVLWDTRVQYDNFDLNESIEPASNSKGCANFTYNELRRAQQPTTLPQKDALMRPRPVKTAAFDTNWKKLERQIPISLVYVMGETTIP